ncbi:MAG: 4Fe-4S dicluster domain-containing protein [Nitrospinae bacterium]|nr:4Fe-4S dicluster domain-containing protein [Nitrospinota bacterium]
MKPIEFDRRAFLRKGPFAFIQAVLTESRAGGADTPRPPLRPPGAAPEEEFLELCCGVGACAEVCPAEAIRLVPGEGDSGVLHPIIVPQEAACIVCEDLACMKACPSGALTLVSREEIRIGRAQVNPDRCLAWSGTDPGCDYCVDRCPLGKQAIRLERAGPVRGPVVDKGCVGCGVCEYFCPAQPSAIRVYPC